MKRDVDKDGKTLKSHRIKGSGNVDAAFWTKIKDLLKIVVPKFWCKETKYLGVLTILIVLRTQMSIWLADINGRVVKAIVEKNLSKFIYRVSLIPL